MMEIDRSLLSKPEHGKYVSIDKLAEIITYNISFIRGNSKGRISQQETLNEIFIFFLRARTASFHFFVYLC